MNKIRNLILDSCREEVDRAIESGIQGATVIDNIGIYTYRPTSCGESVANGVFDELRQL